MPTTPRKADTTDAIADPVADPMAVDSVDAEQAPVVIRGRVPDRHDSLVQAQRARQRKRKQDGDDSSTQSGRGTMRDVLVLVETATTWGSDIVRGIASHARQIGPWSLTIEPRGRTERLVIPEDWDGDAIIARVTHRGLAEQILASGKPAVNVSWYRIGWPDIPRVSTDETGAAELAAEHLIALGHRRFAYCGESNRESYEDRLLQAFDAAVQRAGGTCEVQRDDQPLGEWLANLETPVGILAFNDIQGRRIADACHRMGLRVPDDVAIIGGERDELSSDCSIVPLSSVDATGFGVGRAAVSAIDQMLRGEELEEREWLLPTGGVVARKSTDQMQIEDFQLARALRFIRENYQEPIHVEDILEELSISRRALEQRFRTELNRSPAAEIRRLRIHHAMRLLAESEMSLRAIAETTGFTYAEVMTRCFRRECGISPNAYRAQVQRGDLNPNEPIGQPLMRASQRSESSPQKVAEG